MRRSINEATFPLPYLAGPSTRTSTGVFIKFITPGYFYYRDFSHEYLYGVLSSTYISTGPRTVNKQTLKELPMYRTAELERKLLEKECNSVEIYKGPSIS
jgi:hypothetical protein